ncbi:D-aminoacylase, partial [Candidatus Bathyarchaeota archaeon]
RYVREMKVVSLEEAIKKMTYLPAKRLGLMDRGLLKKKMCADIVIFNADEISDMATYRCPTLYPKGIRYVIVNGEIVVECGRHTGALPGAVLRKGQTA